MKALVSEGAGFIAMTLRRGGRRTWPAVDGHSALTVRHGTVLDDLLEQKLVDDPDVVYHMAATVGVDEHAESACDAEVETNLNGASIVLHAAIRSGTPVLSRFDVRGLW